MQGHETTEIPPRLALLLLSGLLLASTPGCSESESIAASTDPIPASIQARVVQVVEQEWPRVVATQGDLVADETTVIGAKVAGRIDRVEVDLGDQVEEGAVLASLDRREHRERVRQAEAELAQARAALGLDADDELDRLDPRDSPAVAEQKALWDQARIDRDRALSLRSRRVATDSEYEMFATGEQVARARHASALNSVREAVALVRVRAAQLELARQELADAEIRAPFAGRIQERHVSPGTYLQVGDAVATLIRDDPLRYRGTVPEPYAGSIAIGQRVRLRVATGPDLPEVTITRIRPSLDPFSRSLVFEAGVPNREHAVQAGQFAQGEVVLDRSGRAIALPRSAIVEFAGTRKVWKVVDGRAVEQAIELGVRRDDLVEVLGGVAVGDRVLIDGAEGRPARVEPREAVAANPAVASIGPGAIPSP